jgi:hypothetical protein
VVDIVEEYSTYTPTPRQNLATYTPPPTYSPVVMNTKAAAVTSPPTVTDLPKEVIPTKVTASSTVTTPISTHRPQKDNKVSVGGKDRIFGRYPCVEDRKIRFTSAFFPPELITAIMPMGKVAPDSGHVTPTDHLYIHRDPPKGEDTDYVLAPADGEIVGIQRFPEDQHLISGDWSSPKVPDYRVVIMHSCSLFTIFIHLGEFAEDIAAQTGEIQLNAHWSAGQSPPINIKAGQPIGKFGGDSNDWSVHDADTILPGFVVPEHYEMEEWKIHTIDPFTLYDEPVKSALLAKVIREIKPIAGKIDYDIEGTIAGTWFLDGTVDYRGNVPVGTPRYWDGHLYIGYGYIDPTQIRISIGFDTGISNDLCNICRGAYGVQGNQPYPDAVTAESGIIKYELMSRDEQSKWNREQVGDVSLGTLLVEHLGGRTIRTELIVGESPEEVTGFSENSQIYRR